MALHDRVHNVVRDDSAVLQLAFAAECDQILRGAEVARHRILFSGTVRQELASLEDALDDLVERHLLVEAAYVVVAVALRVPVLAHEVEELLQGRHVSHVVAVEVVALELGAWLAHSDQPVYAVVHRNVHDRPLRQYRVVKRIYSAVEAVELIVRAESGHVGVVRVILI